MQMLGSNLDVGTNSALEQQSRRARLAAHRAQWGHSSSAS